MTVRVLSSHLKKSTPLPLKWSVSWSTATVNLCTANFSRTTHVDKGRLEAVQCGTAPCAYLLTHHAKCNDAHTRSFSRSVQQNCHQSSYSQSTSVPTRLNDCDSRGLFERLQCSGNVLSTRVRGMAGHSHWANIKHDKMSADQVKSAVSAKVAYKIKVAIKVGGSPDPAKNSKLQAVLVDAKKMNVPKATIEKVLQRAVASLDTYFMEIAGPDGSFIIAEVECNNRHQGKSSVNASVKKFGLTSDAVNRSRHMFDEKGVISVVATKPVNMDRYLEVAIEAGAEDVIVVEEELEDGPQPVLKFHCEPKSVQAVKTEIENCELEILSAEVEFLPKQWADVSPAGMDLLEKAYKRLSVNELVLRTFDNVRVPEE